MNSSDVRYWVGILAKDKATVDKAFICTVDWNGLRNELLKRLLV